MDPTSHGARTQADPYTALKSIAGCLAAVVGRWNDGNARRNAKSARRAERKGARTQCKATSQYNTIFEAQTLTYLRLSGLKLGLVINFGERLVKSGIHRVVNGL